MYHASKTAFWTLILLLVFNVTMGQVNDTIRLRLNSNDRLINPGITDVDDGDSVIWVIEAGQTIQSFNILGTGHPFNQNLPNPNSNFNLLKRKVMHNGPFQWKYTIKYKIPHHPTRFLDPIISIRPGGKKPYWILWIIISLLGVTGLYFSLTGQRKNKSKMGSQL